jgi:hypothetical protein
VMVDDQVVTTITEPSAAQAGYFQTSLNLSQVGATVFADGQAHTISFEYDNPAASGKSNFNVDDVSLSCSSGN